MTARKHTDADRFLIGLDGALRTVFGRPAATSRPDPAAACAPTVLEPDEAQRSGRLMRVNHSGEVAAQGLYQGQALTARRREVRERMAESAAEENDHLLWCERRVREADTHLSYLNPFWYVGSFTLGALAGAAGDRWSLGFVAETERQVVRHIDDHLKRLPPADAKSHAVLKQMREDEGRHASKAMQMGGRELPGPVRGLMRLVSKVMTETAYWI